MKAASYAFAVLFEMGGWLLSVGWTARTYFSGSFPLLVQTNRLNIGWELSGTIIGIKQGCTPQDGHVMSRNGEPTQYPTFSKCSKESWDDRTLMSLGGSPCYKLKRVDTDVHFRAQNAVYFFLTVTEPCKNITKGSENNCYF
uniref:Uncharacterized protein n=1 Tax=Ixodes ricinus TaxID=34613 RepID=V5H278_IXORI